MSEKNTEIAVAQERSPPADMSKSERDMLFSFKENGMPGIMKVTEEQMVKIKEMYLNGASYTSIAASFRIRKVLILFLSEKGNWLQERAERAQETIKMIEEVVPYIQNDNVIFLAEVSEFFKTYYRKKISEYNTSGNDEIVRTTSLAGLEKYLRVFKLLQEAVGKGDDGSSKNPAVHVHVGEGSNVSISDSGKANGEQDSEKLGEALKILAEMRKRREES